MAKTALYNMEGKTIGEVELSDEIFAANTERPDPRRSPRRRPEDLPPEGHR